MKVPILTKFRYRNRLRILKFQITIYPNYQIIAKMSTLLKIRANSKH